MVLVTFVTTTDDTDGIIAIIVGELVGAPVGAAVGDEVTVITDIRIDEDAVAYPALTRELVQFPLDTKEVANALREVEFPFTDVTVYAIVTPEAVAARAVSTLLALYNATDVIAMLVDLTRSALATIDMKVD